jgi:S-adenosyl-L-methionine hydrolase (adenosine-forming)
MAIVTLLTDFGTADTYVGQVKGAILSVAPGAVLVDLTHSVAAQDVQAGAFLLWAAVEAFPAGATHLAVVDPGVGSSRRAIAVQSGRGDVFVGPDNGLLVPAAERSGGVQRAVELNEPRYWRQQQASRTFHGRDLFGPVAGHIAAGVRLHLLGRSLADIRRPFGLDLAEGFNGTVVHVDTYGNLVTNILASALPEEQFRVRLGRHVITSAAYYAAVAPGALLALVGSAGLLEISARDASAAALTGAQRGTPVTLEPL